MDVEVKWECTRLIMNKAVHVLTFWYNNIPLQTPPPPHSCVWVYVKRSKIIAKEQLLRPSQVVVKEKWSLDTGAFKIGFTIQQLATFNCWILWMCATCTHMHCCLETSQHTSTGIQQPLETQLHTLL